jgi:hypothetical protein
MQFKGYDKIGTTHSQQSYLSINGIHFLDIIFFSENLSTIDTSTQLNSQLLYIDEITSLISWVEVSIVDRFSLKNIISKKCIPLIDK